MGNWVGKDKGVHPAVDEDEGLHGLASKSLMRVKVRMTTRELKELMAKVDMMIKGGDNSDLGGVILQECLEGKFSAHVVAVAADDYGPQVSKYVKGWMLSTISEEEEEHHHHLV